MGSVRGVKGFFDEIDIKRAQGVEEATSVVDGVGLVGVQAKGQSRVGLSKRPDAGQIVVQWLAANFELDAAVAIIEGLLSLGQGVVQGGVAQGPLEGDVGRRRPGIEPAIEGELVVAGHGVAEGHLESEGDGCRKVQFLEERRDSGEAMDGERSAAKAVCEFGEQTDALVALHVGPAVEKGDVPIALDGGGTVAEGDGDDQEVATVDGMAGCFEGAVEMEVDGEDVEFSPCPPRVVGGHRAYPRA